MKLLKTHNIIMSSILLRDLIEGRIPGIGCQVPGARDLALGTHVPFPRLKS
jgi:hypothetical protein